MQAISKMELRWIYEAIQDEDVGLCELVSYEPDVKTVERLVYKINKLDILSEKLRLALEHDDQRIAIV